MFWFESRLGKQRLSVSNFVLNPSKGTLEYLLVLRKFVVKIPKSFVSRSMQVRACNIYRLSRRWSKVSLLNSAWENGFFIWNQCRNLGPIKNDNLSCCCTRCWWSNNPITKMWSAIFFTPFYSNTFLKLLPRFNNLTGKFIYSGVYYNKPHFLCSVESAVFNWNAIFFNRSSTSCSLIIFLNGIHMINFLVNNLWV